MRIPLIEKVYNVSLQWASPTPGVLESQQPGWNKRSGKEANLWFSALRSITLLCLQVGDFFKPINKLGMLMIPLIFAGHRPSCFQCWGYLASLSKHQSPGEDWMLCTQPRATALSRTLLRPWLCTRTCSQCWPSWPRAWRKQRKYSTGNKWQENARSPCLLLGNALMETLASLEVWQPASLRLSFQGEKSDYILLFFRSHTKLVWNSSII